jgi:biopolymer transport protein ExbB
MATTKQAAPAKKSEGFQGVRGAFWIIVVCAIIAFTLFFTWFGNDMHFQDPGVQDHPADIWGTIYKGGVIVPVIHTLLLTVLAMTIERWLALKTATGKGALPKFVVPHKAGKAVFAVSKAKRFMVQHRVSSFWFIAIDLSLSIVYYDRPKMSIKNPRRWCTVGASNPEME